MNEATLDAPVNPLIPEGKLAPEMNLDPRYKLVVETLGNVVKAKNTFTTETNGYRSRANEIGQQLVNLSTSHDWFPTSVGNHTELAQAKADDLEHALMVSKVYAVLVAKRARIIPTVLPLESTPSPEALAGINSQVAEVSGTCKLDHEQHLTKQLLILDTINSLREAAVSNKESASLD